MIAVALLSVSKQKTFMENYSRELSSALTEAKIVCTDLEEMMGNAIIVSKSIAEEIESRVNNINVLPIENYAYSVHINDTIQEDIEVQPPIVDEAIEIPDVIKLRVYELAKELGIPNKELVSIIKGLGINISNHMNSLNQTQIQMVRKAIKHPDANLTGFDSYLNKEINTRPDITEISKLHEPAEEASSIDYESSSSNHQLEFSIEELKAAHPYIAVRTLHENGYSVREMAKMLERGQGEISLILSLSKRKQVV